MWASGTLSDGYYLWRSGKLTDIHFPDGSSLRLNPNLNAGTAAIQYYFAQTHNRPEWEQAVAPSGFAALYERMFGPAWERAKPFEPVIPTGLEQPELTLPFEPGKVWAFSGGPHSAWEEKGAMAALDFAPAAEVSGCVKSDAWVVAPADGVIARTAPGVVILDLDGDGFEQTGWNILFLHIRSDVGKVGLLQTVKKGDHIGHASCEGGIATGTHLHIARKFNGEWMLADGQLPFVMSGWTAHNGPAPYKGSLTKGDRVIDANTSGSFETRIIRDKE
jgi:murein DD-endopeptidase MepM/ murein hydrolase activator NlpD